MEFTKIGAEQMGVLIAGTAIWFVIPLVIAAVWLIRKKEPVLTAVIGAAVFFVFAIVLEKPIQNALLFPTQMMLPETAVSRFFAAHPVLLALAAGLFPGVFEETGRLVAYKTLLKKRKNRETAISCGIGHGGFEVMYLMGMTYVTYIAYAVMINTGTFRTVIDQVAAVAPDQVGSVYAVADQLAAISFTDLGLAIAERISAVLFHIGASILVFYACRDRKSAWLYPLAVLLHTAMDLVCALYLFEVIRIPAWGLEVIVAVFGLATFGGAYFLLYRKDKGEAGAPGTEAAVR